MSSYSPGVFAVVAAAPPSRPQRAAAAPSPRIGGATWLVVAALVGIALVFATDQVLPATSTHQAQVRVWLGARAAGFMALALLTFQVVVGLVLSHPTNKSTWKLSKRLFPWHENAWIFTIAFGAAHVVSLAVDQYAKVGILGSFVPGLSEYRSVPVALGTLSLYAMLATGLTARYTKVLPAGWWLKLHRLSLGVLALAWAHGFLAGSDSGAAAWVYLATFVAVLAAAVYRYWVVRAARPTFASSLKEGHR